MSSSLGIILQDFPLWFNAKRHKGLVPIDTYSLDLTCGETWNKCIFPHHFYPLAFAKGYGAAGRENTSIYLLIHLHPFNLQQNHNNFQPGVGPQKKYLYIESIFNSKLRSVGTRFMEHCEDYREFFTDHHQNSVSKAGEYLAGLLMKGPRKNMERMDEYVEGSGYDSTQQFLQ